MNINQKNKIAVFDLDGTLWRENSHIEILNSYFMTNFYKSYIYRILRHFFSKHMYHHICYKYEKIPKNFTLKFELDFDETVLNILNNKKNEGWFVLLISNAPYEIVFHASERLGIPFLSAPIGHKKEILNSVYSYKELFVCTDNVDDIDLLNASASRKIIWNKYNSDFFISNGYTKENS